MDQFISLLPRFFDGFGMTLLLLLVGGIGAIVLGTIVVAMRISPLSTLRGFATVYTEIVRNTPLTLVLFFCAFVLPTVGSKLDYSTAAMIGLAVYTSPFIAEALRSGINGVPIGQAEAARSLGLGFTQTIGTVILPQAFRMTIPPLINVLIALTKNTSVAGGFFVLELYARGAELVNSNGNIAIPVLIGVAVFYLIITVPLGVIAGMFERRWAVKR